MAQRPPFSSIQHFLLQDERHPQNFAWRGSCPSVSAHARWRCPGPPCIAIHGFYPHFRYPPKSVWLPCGKPDAFLFPQAGEKSFPEPPSQRPAGRIAAAVILLPAHCVHLPPGSCRRRSHRWAPAPSPRAE